MSILSRLALIGAIWGAVNLTVGLVRHDSEKEKLGYYIFGIAGAVFVLAGL